MCVAGGRGAAVAMSRDAEHRGHVNNSEPDPVHRRAAEGSGTEPAGLDDGR